MIDRYVLTIVHMQSDFRAAMRQATLSAVWRELGAAMDHGMPVILVEADRIGGQRCHDTHECLWDLMRDYDSWGLVRTDFDFVGAIMRGCASHHFPATRFRLVGVDAEDAVRKIALGIKEFEPYSYVELVRDACHSESNGFESIWAELDAAGITLATTGFGRRLRSVT